MKVRKVKKQNKVSNMNKELKLKIMIKKCYDEMSGSVSPETWDDIEKIIIKSYKEGEKNGRLTTVYFAKAVVDTTIKMLMFSERDIMLINLNQGSVGLAKESNDKLKVLSREINRQIESINQLPLREN